MAEILQQQLAEIAGLIEQGHRDDDAAGRRDGLQADREVDPAAVDIVEIEDDRLPMDADPKCDAALRRLRGLVREHLALQLGGAADRVERAFKYGDEAIAGVFYDLASM